MDMKPLAPDLNLLLAALGAISSRVERRASNMTIAPSRTAKGLIIS
jgi:hypothetical protein